MPPTIPSWLARLVEDNPPGPLARQYSKAQATVAPGQLRYAPAPGQGYDELLLVLETSSQDDVLYAACILVAGPGDLDMQDDTDLVLDPAESELPYAVLAQASITVVVQVDYLGQHVGTVEPGLTEAIRQLRDREAGAISALLGRLGLPLQGPGDRRWNWKAEQAADAWALSSTI